MSPYDQIKAKYEASEHIEAWNGWIEYFLLHGFLFATPELFVAAEPRHYIDLEKPDCWYIFAMAGDMAKAWEMLPYNLPWTAFERVQDGKRDLRFYRTDDLRRLSRISHESIATYQDVPATRI